MAPPRYPNDLRTTPRVPPRRVAPRGVGSGHVSDLGKTGRDRPPAHTVVIAGASAGGVEALVALVRSLPSGFPHPIIVILHVAPTGTSVLPQILARACRLPVHAPTDGETLLPGHVYVAPPDNHLVIEDSVVRLSQAPRENGHRPAIDPTMRTAAGAFDGATIGIVLSGSRDDGTAGLMAIKAGGGIALVQDPDEALYPAMPLNARTHVDVDAVLPVGDMADWILAHVSVERGERPNETPMDPDLPDDPPPDPVVNDLPGAPRSAPGEGTRFTCPDCGGVLFERDESGLERFECSVGHVFSIESLSSAQAEALENALWAAVRSLEDRAVLLRRLGRRAQSNGQNRSSDAFERQAAEALDRAATIRDAIQRAAAEDAVSGA
jgi:two-component system, chemotaxis family, protein-glutamate methylesterase/glutaminase